ncbi:MAG: DNA-binding protein [Alphaproteobacteria bacterium]
MALTRDFKETVMARARQDREFREGLLTEAVECFLAGDIDTGKILLRDYINATIGFPELGRLTNKQSTSLMRMLGPGGNPAARNLFEIIAHLQKKEGIHFKVRRAR